MLKRSGLLLSIIVFLFTFALFLNDSGAHDDGEGLSEEKETEYNKYHELIAQAERDLDDLKDFYKYPHSVLGSLNSAWDDDMAKYEDGKRLAVDSATSAIITTIAAAAAAPTTGGVSIGVLVLVNLSIVKDAYKVGQGLADAAEGDPTKKGYFDSYSTTFSAISEIDSAIETIYSEYETLYHQYLNIRFTHSTRLVRLDLSQNPPTEFTYEYNAFFEAVNGWPEDRTEPPIAGSILSRTPTGWYHPPESSVVGHTHSITTIRHRSYFDVPLSLTYDCQHENCEYNATFSTPYEAFITHGTRCEGCSRVYFSCANNYDSYLKGYHKLRECNMKIWEVTADRETVAVDCPDQYRDCTYKVRRHTSRYSDCTENPPDESPYFPQNLSLTPGITTMRLDWTAPASSGSSEITDYEYSYRRKTIGIDSWTEWSSAGTDFSEIITGLQADTDYEVSLRAHNSVGYGSATKRSVRTNSRDEEDDEEVSTPPAVFTPSLSLTYNSSTSSVSMTATASEPIYGAHLYVRFPGDTSRYGTQIDWTFGNSNRTTYALPVNYSFPSPASSGTYKFTLRVYPFNNSGSGDAWGDPYDVFENVTVE